MGKLKNILDWDKKEVTGEQVIADIELGIALYKYNNMGTSHLSDKEKLILQTAGYWKEI